MKNQSGFSFIQLMIMAALLAGIVITAVNKNSSFEKQNNHFEFIGKADQLQLAIQNQVLSDKRNCGCLFSQAESFPVAGIETLEPGQKVRAIGNNKFNSTPGGSGDTICYGATIPNPIITNEGLDGIKLDSVKLSDVKFLNNAYTGDLVIFISSLKDVLGPSVRRVLIKDVKIDVVNTGDRVKLQSCYIGKDENIYGIDYYEVKALRNHSNTKSTDPAKKYRFCSLSLVRSGGNNGGNEDVCKISSLGDGVWSIFARRGDDPDIICGMRCTK